MRPNPRCDLPKEVGGLLVLEGSSSLGGFGRKRRTYGSQLDSCRADLHQLDSVFIAKEPAELLRFDPAARWVSGGAGGFRAGDCVIFQKHAVHGASSHRW
jgi:hypothetical protein